MKNKKIYDNLKLNYVEKGSYSNISHCFEWINLDDIDKYLIVPSVIKCILDKNSNVHYTVGK